jgi:hypothetical protein
MNYVGAERRKSPRYKVGLRARQGGGKLPTFDRPT